MTGRLFLLSIASLAVFAASTSYQDDIAEWRRNRQTRLQQPGGWLTVTGLFWLKEGNNRYGSAPGNDIVLPDGPKQAGVFTLRKGAVTLNGRTVEPDADEPSVKVGRLSLHLIKRGDRFAIRLKDPASEYLRKFHGLQYFPVNTAYRVTARFVPQPRKIPILNIIGQTEPTDSPGYVVFRLQGKEFRLYPVLESADAKELFYIFRDLTAGKETYGAGRFLYSEMPSKGQVTLDFNKAYSPPCAFTPYATCPLPPKENRLQIRIEAGEKSPH